ncbi:MAG: NAD(P)H-dependent oxidoreductase [Acidobacteria bacterium RBG_16_64_8]|nr:MAG: NAD(P)H-dependent oxidoreductase [Acidobacteria bacterium RBG_16_64_8]
MEFQEIVAQRYAAKKFDGRTIPPEKVDQLVELIRLAPSALNLQPWKIKVVGDPQLKDQLASAVENREMAASASHTLVFCANSDVAPLIKKLSEAMLAAGVAEEIRHHVLELANGVDANLSPEQKKEWATRQVYLAVSNAIYGAKALGFDSCPVTSFEPGEFARILGIPAHLHPVIIVHLGYAAYPAKPKLRFPAEDILF